MKDNFSLVSKEYAQFRPKYPAALFNFLFSLINEKSIAWDAGTGNGQVAGVLADYFTKVFATDISKNQLLNAIKKKNIFYLHQAAEETTFPDNNFDLITVAQAVHWFNFDNFNKEVQRTLKPSGILAIFGYSLLRTATDADHLIEEFYNKKLGRYWDQERKYIEDGYHTIPFPFEEIPAPAFEMEAQWSLQNLIGYFNTWSAVQHYKKINNYNPVEELALELQKFWSGKSIINIYFPLILRIGKLKI
jgi:ubiquinone/menaquinone biosynthesis C-methylase UbiE